MEAPQHKNPSRYLFPLVSLLLFSGFLIFRVQFIIYQQNWHPDQSIEMVGKVVTAPSQFPSLTHSHSLQKGRDDDAVHSINIPQGDTIISQWAPDLGPRLRVIWAIILSVFVHDDSVMMGYEECADSRDSAYLLQHCSSVYTTTIDREDDLNALVGSGHLLETDSHDPRVFNTGVLLLDGRNGRSDLAPKNGSSPTDSERVSNPASVPI